MVTRNLSAQDLLSDTEQKQVALSYLHEAWAEATHDGIDADCLAQACLFSALSEMIATYGEEATAKFTENLSARVMRGEFSVIQSRQ